MLLKQEYTQLKLDLSLRLKCTYATNSINIYIFIYNIGGVGINRIGRQTELLDWNRSCSPLHGSIENCIYKEFGFAIHFLGVDGS